MTPTSIYFTFDLKTKTLTSFSNRPKQYAFEVSVQGAVVTNLNDEECGLFRLSVPAAMILSIQDSSDWSWSEIRITNQCGHLPNITRPEEPAKIRQLSFGPLPTRAPATATMIWWFIKDSVRYEWDPQMEIDPQGDPPDLEEYPHL